MSGVSTLSVQTALDQFLNSPNVALAKAASPSTGEQLKQAFMEGLCSGVSIAVRAFETSKVPAELQAKLEQIAKDIDVIVPDGTDAAGLAIATAKGNA